MKCEKIEIHQAVVRIIHEREKKKLCNRDDSIYGT